VSLYRRAGSQFWWSKLYAGGRVHRFSTGARHKVEALKKEREEASRLDRLFKSEGNRSIATLAAQFLENTEASNRAEATRAKREEHLTNQIIPFLGAHREVTTVTVRDLEEFKARRMKDVSAQTVCKELSTLRQMLRYAEEVLKLFPPGEAPTTRNPKLPKYEPKWRLLTSPELARLIAELMKATGKAREAVPYFVLMMNTGMRTGEVSALTWSWVDLEKRELHLPATVTKTRTARDVPLNESALAALLMVKPERAVGRVFRARSHYAAWHVAVHAAGLARLNEHEPRVEVKGQLRIRTSGVRPHDLRHSYGSLLHAAGVSTPEVRDILGHVTLMMANLYAHTFRERLHTAVNAVNVGGGPVPKTVPLTGQNVPEKVAIGNISNGAVEAVSATGK
jgi:integrase